MAEQPPAPGAPAKSSDPLKIEVAPDIVEHLGLNLYTNLPRVLVEYVANAYDADSPWTNIIIDTDAIARARDTLRDEWKKKTDRKEVKPEDKPLAEHTLPEDLTITIEDRGSGMLREDLQTKFLRIARKRRKDKNGDRSENGRPVMGRKGIGKLAGFGIARRIQIVTKPKGQAHAIKITLDYDLLTGHDKTENVPVQEEPVNDGAGLGPNGTKIILSKLVFEPVGAREDTITGKVAEHFAIIKAEEFEIRLNGKPIQPFDRKFVYAYPKPKTSSYDLIDGEVPGEDGKTIKFRYRIRFTGARKQLNAGERGIRVYARQRLAAAPDLLDLGTGMHGFQNTHYLDGVVYADFIDEQPSDYIASDRHTLRWDTPLLSPLRKFLTEEMKKACVDYQGDKVETLAQKVLSDGFTKETIEKWELPPHRRDTAFRIAAKLAAGCPDQLEDDYYKETLPVLVKGLGYGELLAAIAQVAKNDVVRLEDLAEAIADLSAAEWDDYSRIIMGRLRAIESLSKLYKNIDFTGPKNEQELHDLLKMNPWLIDPTFSHFLTSNVTEKTLSDELCKHLEVDVYVPKKFNKDDPDEQEALKSNKRPDLVFLLSNYALGRIVVVELKAPNIPLHGEHLAQLENYLEDVEQFIKGRKGKGERLKVEGYLIGTRDRGKYAKDDRVKHLARRERERGTETPWRVFDIGELLEVTQDAHRELLNVYEAAQKKAEEAAAKEKAKEKK